MKRFYLILCSFLFLGIVALPAQRLEEFSEVHAEFISQLEQYMTDGRSQAVEANYRDFESVFKSGMFSEEEVDMIMTTGNLMLSKRMSANPYFSSYLKVLVKVKNTEDSERRFKEWHEVLNNILADEEAGRSLVFNDFLNFSMTFLEYHTLRYSESGTSWFAICDDYSLKYDDEGPFLEFEKLDLMASWKKDSIFIRETSGRFYPADEIWRGSGGKVTWDRFDWDSDIFVEFPEYEFLMKRSLYEVKNARLHYPLFFGTKVVEGDFSDKLTVENKVTGSSYPRFESYDKRLQLKNIGEGIEYVGGFRLYGTTIYGFGTNAQRAMISIFDDKETEVFTASSEFFTIRREEQIVGESVRATFFFGKDSLYHPSVNMRFDIQNRQMELSRGKRGNDRNPFYSTIHEVNMDADRVFVYLDRDSVVIGKETISIANKPDVFFESHNYFNDTDYQRFQNIASANPIAIMKVTAEREGTNYLDANLIAQRINSKFTVENIQGLLYDLSAKGFINYDSDKQQVEVKGKVFHYADAAQGKVDYDNLRIRSKSDTANAVLNLRDSSITINGVKNIEFSRRQKVAIIPDTQQVKLKANRDMDFDGALFAGFGTMEGTGFTFDYDKFQIQMDSVRYFDLFVPTGEFDQDNNPVAMSIASRIERLTGVLLIDAPSNKSGRENIIMFPSLQSQDKSYVFYEDKSIQDSVYLRDSFYFELDPFSFNHLDAFTEKDLRFEGRLISNEIFPVIKETLVLQEDKSLGFITSTPEDGLANYQGKGKFTGEINLSNKGLTGNGTQQYLNASVNSEDLAFRPQEALATAEEFNLAEDRVSEIQVPQVHGEAVNIQWRPYKDSLYVKTKELPFSLFKQEDHTFDGTLILTPGGLKGDGLLNWGKANMSSDYFSFGAFSAEADTSSVNIRAFNTQEFALMTKNVYGYVDFDEKIGTFKANEDFLETILPYNQYLTSMNEFDWDMEEETITFKTEQGSLGTFVSIHPDQDSLRFQGQDAFYDLKTNELNISGVPFMISADAFVYPDSGLVDIQSGGVMTTLENARIVADTISKYHVINRATVNVMGRKEYRASGFYEYNVAGREQEIEFAQISGTRIGKGARSEKQVATRATGEVTEEADFYIDHKTKFKGEISLKSEERNLYFDGFAQLDADRLPQRNWFTVSSKGDKENLAIRFESPKDFEGYPMETGLFLSRETAQIYPSVMMPLRFRKDRPILPVTGVFDYDEKSDAFIFGDSLRLLANDLRGNKLVFNNSDGTVVAEGVFNLGSGLKYVNVVAAGKAKTEFPKPESNIISDTDTSLLQGPSVLPVEFDLMAGIDLIVPERLLKLMALDLQSSSFDARDINYLTNIEFFKKATMDLFPDEPEVKEAIDFMSSGFLDLPAKFNTHTFLLSPLKMKWDPDYQSFVTTDPKKVGVISVNGESINKTLTCYVEFKMPTNEDDRLYIYVKSPSELYYFFGFKQGILSITSNNPKFMDELLDLKAKDLIQKMPDGETYEIQVVEPSTAKLFLRRMEAVGK